MDFAHETKKKQPYVMAEKKATQKPALHGYPYTSFWDLLRQCDSIHPLLHKMEYK